MGGKGEKIRLIWTGLVIDESLMSVMLRSLWKRCRWVSQAASRPPPLHCSRRSKTPEQKRGLGGLPTIPNITLLGSVPTEVSPCPGVGEINEG